MTTPKRIFLQNASISVVIVDDVTENGPSFVVAAVVLVGVALGAECRINTPSSSTEMYVRISSTNTTVCSLYGNILDTRKLMQSLLAQHLQELPQCRALMQSRLAHCLQELTHQCRALMQSLLAHCLPKLAVQTSSASPLWTIRPSARDAHH